MPLLLVAWTIAIWTVRIRNVVRSDAGAASLVAPIALTVLAVAALIDRRRGTVALAGTTIVLWLVRVPLVLVHHHSAPFKVVHVVLALISWALAVGALRSVTSRTAA